MEQYPIKSVTFGGFDKQDVIQYLEKQSREAAAVQEQFQKESGDLKENIELLTGQLEDVQSEVESLQAECDRLKGENSRLKAALAQETAARQALERLKPLEEEVERLRPDAQAYAQFRERIGAIECEARKRADDLETATLAQLQKTVEQFQVQYRSLVRTFESTAGHVTGELRKVEVNLSQLPRAMDPATAALNMLSAQLEHPERPPQA